MAKLSSRHIISVHDLEKQLGVNRLPAFIHDAETEFLDMTDRIVQHIASHPGVKAVFVSGPTSSGKTTFTERLAMGIRKIGRNALRLSLDDFYDVKDIQFDEYGRPDYESVSTIDILLAGRAIQDLLFDKPVLIPEFNFLTRQREWPDSSDTTRLGQDGIVLVEGLHGLAPEIVEHLPRESWIGAFIMPYGDIVADKKLFSSEEFRLLRRIVRDERHRGAHALATIDYWPMISSAEKKYFESYLARADFYVNSILSYESLVIAPIAREDIRIALERHKKGDLEPSVFLARTLPPKDFAQIDLAVARAEQLLHDLSRIPEVPHSIVPNHSILQEFIGAL